MVCAFSQIGAVNTFKKIAKTGNIPGEMGIAELAEDAVLSNPPKNTPSIALGLDGDEFGIVGASPTIN
jgi:hypothetical protein